MATWWPNTLHAVRAAANGLFAALCAAMPDRQNPQRGFMLRLNAVSIGVPDWKWAAIRKCCKFNEGSCK